MSKLLTTGLIIMSALLLAGSIYFPDNAMMWLASTSTTFVVIRAVLIAVLFILLFTNPPRSRRVRTIFGLSAITLVFVIFEQIAHHSLFVLDMLVFAQAAVVLAIEALEYNPDAEKDVITHTGTHLRFQ